MKGVRQTILGRRWRNEGSTIGGRGYLTIGGDGQGRGKYLTIGDDGQGSGYPHAALRRKWPSIRPGVKAMIST